MKYKAYTINNFRSIPQLSKLSEQELFEIEVVSHILPFKTNSYVVDDLIKWENVPDDPIFILTFPQKEMLKPDHYDKMASLLKNNAGKKEISEAAHEIRMQLNPHPAGQLELNVPMVNGVKLIGVQHKYRETVLFFPSQGQTCHAYCTFCFRWPQFTGIDDLKFASKESELLVKYLKAHPEASNLLFTGGDPMVMSAKLLGSYIDSLLNNDIPHLETIRIGTKALAYWPYKFFADRDSDELLRIFSKVEKAGKHLAIMAHFNHPRELKTKAVKDAINAIRSTGAQIRTQSPLLRHINDDPKIWISMWKKQVNLGCIPYYMFVARDTGAQHYFNVSLDEAVNIFRKAYTKVSGVCRTVRGPSMSASPGKVQVISTVDINDEKLFLLQFLQGRNPDWVKKPFFAKYNPDAVWLNDLEPALGEEKFFWEDEFNSMYDLKHEELYPNTED